VIGPVREPAPAIAAAPPRVAHLDDALFLAGGLAWCAGAIHVQAAISHFSEYVLYSVFFAVLAGAQFLLGIAIFRRLARTLLVYGAYMSLAIVLLWILSRTSGLPIGPERWRAEPAGTADILASADELLLAALVACQLGAGRFRGLRRTLVRSVTAVGTFLILLSSVFLTLGSGHVH
jgi:hypothetical protein